MEKIELNREIASLIQKIKQKFDKMNVENDPTSDPWLILTEVEMLYQKLIVLKYVHETERKKQQAAVFSNSEAVEEAVEEVIEEVRDEITEKIEEVKTKEELQESIPPRMVQSTPPNNDLKKLIGFNERILFTRELFHNSASEYEAAINELNQFTNFSEAQVYIKTNVVEKNKVQQDNEALEDFVALVKRRFV